jgi:hypothetical protein
MGKRTIRSILVAAATTVAVLAGMQAAGHAASGNSPGYPRFSYEGLYPEQTWCNGHFRLQQSRVGYWNGRSITLKYFYSDGCGSFGRIENAPRECYVIVDRSTDWGRTWAWVLETVDAGDTFAYTKLANNLNGRVSRAALACNGNLITRTNWY